MVCRYPYNLDFDFGALEGLNKFSINNLGDPFIESNYGVHSREFEVRWALAAATAAAMEAAAAVRTSCGGVVSSKLQRVWWVW